MNSIFTGDLIARFLSLDRFQSDFRLQLCAVSLAYSWHPFPPFFVSLDTAILSYRPVQDLGTIIVFVTCAWLGIVVGLIVGAADTVRAGVSVGVGLENTGVVGEGVPLIISACI